MAINPLDDKQLEGLRERSRGAEHPQDCTICALLATIDQRDREISRIKNQLASEKTSLAASSAPNLSNAYTLDGRDTWIVLAYFPMPTVVMQNVQTGHRRTMGINSLNFSEFRVKYVARQQVEGVIQRIAELKIELDRLKTQPIK